MKKRIVSLLTAFALLCSSASAALDNFTVQRTYSSTFADVAPTAWYYDSVKTAYELGLVNGSSATAYAPDSTITVAEVQTIVARIHSTYHGNTIAPAAGPWYAPYIEYCISHIDSEVCSMAYMADNGAIVADTPATRAYFAYLMYAALPANEYTAINSIPDGALQDVDDLVFLDADERIYTLYRAGILTGSDAYGAYNPDTYITRAEVAAIIARMIDPSQRKMFELQQKPQSTLEQFTGNWYFESWPDSGLKIEKIGSAYYASLSIVQGNGTRVNGTMEPVELIHKGSYYESKPFDTWQATTAVLQLRPVDSQLIVSCDESGFSSLSIDFTGEYCSRRS